MSSEEQLIVTLDAPDLGSARPVGVLTRYQGPRTAIAFAYARSWLDRAEGFALEPRLPLVEGPQYAPDGGFPSVLRDTTPDLWGRLLLERREALAADREGRRARRLSDWEFLVGVADETRMGALRLRRGVDGPFIDDRDPSVPPMTDLRALEAAARAFEENPGDPIADPTIARLITPGSSLGGARPKANFRGLEGDLWFAKFPSRTDRQDSGAWEEVYARLARAAGIEVAETSLLRLGMDGRTFATRRFVEGDLRQLFQAGRRNQPTLIRLIARTESLEEMLGLPELARARLPKLVEPARANQRLQFLSCWGDTAEEVRQRVERPACAGFKYRVGGACSQALHPRQRHANGFAVRHKRWSGFVHRGRQKFRAEPVTFEDIDEWMVKAFPIRQHGGHELGGKVSFEPGRLIRFNTVGGAVRLAKSVAGESCDEFPHLGCLLRRVTARMSGF